jgi:hypothetical protein
MVLNIDNAQAYEVLYLICKIFYISNQLEISPYLTKKNNLDSWILFFKTLLDRSVPEELESFVEDMNIMEGRDKNIIWKTKGIAAKASYRLFERYGHPKYVDERLEAFA